MIVYDSGNSYKGILSNGEIALHKMADELLVNDTEN